MGTLSDLGHLLRREPGATRQLLVSAISSSLAGACTAGLITTVHRAIEAGADASDALAFGLLWVGHGVFGVLALHQVTEVIERLLLGFRLELAERVLAAPLAVSEELGEARLLALFTGVIHAIGHAIDHVPEVLSRVVLLVGLFAYMTWLSPVLTGVVLGVAALGGVAYVLPIRAYGRVERAKLVAERDHLEQFDSLTRGLKELLQSYPRRRALMAQLLVPSGLAYRRASVRRATLREALGRWQEMYGLLALGCMLFVLPRFELVTPAEVGQFLLVLLFVVAPVRTLVNVGFHLQGLRAALDELAVVGVRLGEKAGLEAPPRLLPEGAAPFPLELDEVCYRFPADEGRRPFQLGPLSLRVNGPQTLFVTGGNGSGKSTLAKLLCGLYPAHEGRLRVGGREVNPERAAGYRELVASLFFDFHVFETLLGLEGEDGDARANALLERLDLHHKVTVREGRFSDLRLSQGQRKRLALVGALLEDRPICVFDEWAADQDPDWKRVFYRELIPELRAQGKLVVVITHDESYFELADTLLRLEDGALVRLTESSGGDE